MWWCDLQLESCQGLAQVGYRVDGAQAFTWACGACWEIVRAEVMEEAFHITGQGEGSPSPSLHSTMPYTLNIPASNAYYRTIGAQ